MLYIEYNGEDFVRGILSQGGFCLGGGLSGGFCPRTVHKTEWWSASWLCRNSTCVNLVEVSYNRLKYNSSSTLDYIYLRITKYGLILDLFYHFEFASKEIAENNGSKNCTNGRTIANFKDLTGIFKAQSSFLFFVCDFINIVISKCVSQIRFRKHVS